MFDLDQQGLTHWRDFYFPSMLNGIQIPNSRITKVFLAETTGIHSSISSKIACKYYYCYA